MSGSRPIFNARGACAGGPTTPLRTAPHRCPLSGSYPGAPNSRHAGRSCQAGHPRVNGLFRQKLPFTLRSGNGLKGVGSRRDDSAGTMAAVFKHQSESRQPANDRMPVIPPVARKRLVLTGVDVRTGSRLRCQVASLGCQRDSLRRGTKASNLATGGLSGRPSIGSSKIDPAPAPARRARPRLGHEDTSPCPADALRSLQTIRSPHEAHF